MILCVFAIEFSTDDIHLPLVPDSHLGVSRVLRRYAISGTLDPYVVSCGANPCVFGMLALMSVELGQSWK